MSKQVLLEKLTDKNYRDAFISDEIDIGLPMQLRAMREARGWNQGYVAHKMDTKQPRFSLMEKPGYGKYSLSTLKKIASLFNVGLIVSFVPFSEMIEFVDSFSRKRLAIPGFADEYEKMARRYAGSRDAHETTQTSFDFIASTSTQAGPSYNTTGTSSGLITVVERPSHGQLVSIPMDPSLLVMEKGENTYVASAGR